MTAERPLPSCAQVCKLTLNWRPHSETPGTPAAVRYTCTWEQDQPDSGRLEVQASRPLLGRKPHLGASPGRSLLVKCAQALQLHFGGSS